MYLIKDREHFLSCESMRIKFDIFDSPVHDDRIFYRTTSNILMTFFKILTKKSKYENIEKINFDEYNWFEKTKNYGLIFTKTGIYNSYGYDFKNYYGSILGNNNSDFKIPTKRRTSKQSTHSHDDESLPSSPSEVPKPKPTDGEALMMLATGEISNAQEKTKQVKITADASKEALQLQNENLKLQLELEKLKLSQNF